MVKLTTEQAQAALAEELDRELPPGEATLQVRLLSILGLLPEHYPLREKLLEVLGEQVAGFYLPRRRQLVVVDMPPEKLRAATAGVDLDVFPVVLAHELDHALTDQHFDLTRLLDDPAVRQRDDLLLARESLAEGDATLAMMLFFLHRAGFKPTAESFPPADALRAMVQNLGPGTFPQLSQAPVYVKSQLMEPYLLGLDLVVTAWKAGGWKAVDELWKDPPASTKQLLHPEHRHDQPTDVAITGVPDGYTVVTSMELGELGLRTWLAGKLSAEEAARATTGWAGDRVALLERSGPVGGAASPTPAPPAGKPGETGAAGPAGTSGAAAPTATSTVATQQGAPGAAALLVSVWDSPQAASAFAASVEKWRLAAAQPGAEGRVEQRGKEVRLFLRPAVTPEASVPAKGHNSADHSATAPESGPKPPSR